MAERPHYRNMADLLSQTSVPFFPFLTNALFLGTTSGGGSLNTPSVFLLSLNTIPHDTVNVDGFTIIDITDPAIPRYAFFLDEELMGPSKYVNPYRTDMKLHSQD